MTSLTIERVRARYCMPQPDEEERRRLDGVLERALGPGLEAGVALSGIRDTELVCVRRLEIPFQARLTRTEAALAGEWAEAFAAELHRSVARGGAAVVRYASPAAALLDLVRRVARGELGRSWAWRSLGLWEGGDQPSPLESAGAVARALASRPRVAAPVLERAAGEAPVRRFLFGRLTPADWHRIAAAALREGGHDPGVVGAEAISGGHRNAQGHDPESALRKAVSHAGPVEASALAWAARAARVDQATARAVAALVLLAVAPRSLVSGGGPGASISAVADALTPTGSRVRSGARSPAVPETARGSQSAGSGAVPRATAGPEKEPRRAGAERARDVIAPEAATGPAPERGGAGAEGPHPAPLGERAATIREARTRHGGLLFLLNIVAEPGQLEALARASDAAARTLPWTLNRLGTLLAETADDDPAVLAFCGRGPGDPPPARGGPPPTPEEMESLQMWTRRLRDGVRARLGAEEGREGPVTGEVIRRGAVVAADPGWIEVRFSLRDLDPAIRRAGLDLDPGWLPWLGTVVSFAYV